MEEQPVKQAFRATICAVLVLTLFVFAFPAYAASVQITLPNFNVTLNQTEVENATRQYPLIVYKDITYFPMTYHDCRFLGLESEYSGQTGLEIQKTGVTAEYNAAKLSGKNPQNATAQTASFPIRVNGKVVDNTKEEYPLLLYKDITYFPLTWRFAVDEFGWDYGFDNVRGLAINSTPSGSSTQSGSVNPGQTGTVTPPSSEESITAPSSNAQTLTTVGWSGEYNEKDVAIRTAFVIHFSGWPLTFAVSDLSDMHLTKDGKEIAFTFSGDVEEQPLRGSGDPQTGFHVALSKPLTEPGVYVMTGAYKGKAFTTDGLVVD